MFKDLGNIKKNSSVNYTLLTLNFPPSGRIEFKLSTYRLKEMHFTHIRSHPYINHLPSNKRVMLFNKLLYDCHTISMT
jgi:hypothetical protein